MTAHGTQTVVGLGIVLLSACAARRPPSQAPAPAGAQMETLDPEAVKATLRRVAHWQLAHPVRFDPRNWAMAPLYDGLISASEATGDPRYLAAVVRAGLRILWQPGNATYHADD